MSWLESGQTLLNTNSVFYFNHNIYCIQEAFSGLVYLTLISTANVCGSCVSKKVKYKILNFLLQLLTLSPTDTLGYWLKKTDCRTDLDKVENFPLATFLQVKSSANILLDIIEYFIYIICKTKFSYHIINDKSFLKVLVSIGSPNGQCVTNYIYH